VKNLANRNAEFAAVAVTSLGGQAEAAHGYVGFDSNDYPGDVGMAGCERFCVCGILAYASTAGKEYVDRKAEGDGTAGMDSCCWHAQEP
jgi:hypothetical protein